MIMGAGIAASPHFPELQMISHEGKAFFTRRIEPLSGSCDPMSFRSGLPGPALLPSQAPFRDFARHCCPASPFRYRPGRSPDFAGRSGKWVRHWLAPLPRASSSLAPPFASLGSGLAAFPALPRWRQSRSALPFPAGRSRPANGSCASLPSRTSGFWRLRDDSRGANCWRPVDSLWISGEPPLAGLKLPPAPPDKRW